MLTILLLHIVITSGCLLAGLLFYILINKVSPETGFKPVIVYLITGLIIISILYQLLVLFFPVNYYLKSILWILLTIGGFACRKKCNNYLQYLISILRKSNRLLISLVISAWFMIVLISAGPTIMDDTESYHIPVIKWTQEYGTVPGLVNLHERFGFNSAWLTLVSVFTPSHDPHNYYAVMNGLLSMWLSAYLFTALWQSFDRKPDGAGNINTAGIVFILFFAIVCWPLLRGNAANANYDFVTTFVITVLFIELWKKRTEFPGSNYLTGELLLWPFFLFTVRIINFPLLLLSFFALIQLIRLKKVWLLYSLGSVCIVIVSAFVIRNVMLSGYLFYPVYQVDIFSFDWKADPEITRQLTVFIKYFNRIPSWPIEETQKLSGISWIPPWFRDLQAYDKLVVVAGLAGFCVAIANIKKHGRINNIAVFFIPVLLFQLATWMLIAPDTRFAYGPLLAGCYLLTVPFEQTTRRFFTNRIRMLLCMVLASAMLLYGNVKIISNRNYRNFFLPALLPSPPVHTIRLSNIELRIPEKINGNWNARCYGTPLPCLYNIQPGLHARGNKIEDGFKIER